VAVHRDILLRAAPDPRQRCRPPLRNSSRAPRGYRRRMVEFSRDFSQLQELKRTTSEVVAPPASPPAGAAKAARRPPPSRVFGRHKPGGEASATSHSREPSISAGTRTRVEPASPTYSCISNRPLTAYGNNRRVACQHHPFTTVRANLGLAASAVGAACPPHGQTAQPSRDLSRVIRTVASSVRESGGAGGLLPSSRTVWRI
jgi:hypothetical protein